MFFQKLKTPGIAHVSYVLGEKEAAIVVDPRRDVDAYLRLAHENSLQIRFILETHRQEDFVIGSRELARLTGAKIVTFDHGLFGHSDIRLQDGEELQLTGLKVRALHTPGHTPESTCYAVYLDEAPTLAWGAFTGDTLFVGEAGRTDLTDPLKTGEHAIQLLDSIRNKLLPLGDQTLVWPAHGSGSVCGGNIAERDESTLGLERMTNPAFQLTQEEFVAAKLRERIPRPPYFTLMEKLNLEGGAPLAKPYTSIPWLPPKKFASEMKQGLVLDARNPEAFAGGHVPGSLSLWLKGLAVFGGWVATETTAVYLVLDDASDAEGAILSLARLGIDRVEAVLAGGFDARRDAGLPISYSETIAPRELQAAHSEYAVLDVRDDMEFEDEGHIEGASHLYVGYLEDHLKRVAPSLREKSSVAVVCSVGHRAGLAASILRRHGFARVANLLGGMTAWEHLKLPVSKGKAQSITTPDIEGERK